VVAPKTHPAETAPGTDRPAVLVVGTQSIHVRRFVQGLCEAGRSVVLVTDRAERLVEHPGLREQLCVDFAVRSWRTPGRIAQAIRRWQPSVVHAHQANSVGWHAVRAARRCGVPCVLTLWGSDVLTLPARGALLRWMVRSTLRGAQVWTADARALLDAAEAVAGPCRGTRRAWIPIGIDPPRAPTGVVREHRLLSCRLHKPLYRIDAIVRAMAALPQRHADWVLEVAAGGEQTEALRALAASLGLGARVEFTGMLSPDALARAYRRAAVFVSVPESDGTSVSLLEAMAAGCLPVLSDLPANREWVEDRTNGLLVADLARLPEALAGAIEWWESGRWDAQARPANERRVAEQATLPANIRQFIALYAPFEERGA
jgi:glycosyltransferase involved in cell wall biosynthesis